MTKIFTVPFAENGDKISPPDAVQPDGSVSYNLGYGFDYQRDTSLDSGGAPVDPLAKVFPREQHNGILNDVTTAIGEMQINGLPIWQSVGSPYPVNALVRYSGSNWRSTAANNSTTPGAPGSSWVDINYQPYSTEASAGVIRISTAQQALDWSDDLTAMTPIKVKASMDKKLPFVPVQQGGGLGQGSNNKLYLGFNIAAGRPSIVVDAQNYGGIAFTGDLPVQATGSTLGVLKLATIAEIIGGVDTLSAVSPAGLKVLFPKRSFSGRDYLRIPDVPGGLIIQWVLDAPEATSASELIAFPVPFPNSLLGVSATLNAQTTGGLGQTTNMVVAASRTSFQYTSGGTFGGGGVAYVLAWGY